MTTGLEVRDLRFTYEGWPETLRGVDLAIQPGECVFLLGPSGAGKTTILRCIAGLEERYHGTVRWDDAPLDGLAPHERGVGMLFQEPALFPHLPVWRNIAFGMRYHGVPRAKERETALAWLDLVGLRMKADAAIDALSGGERQRVALARTLAAKPRVVLLDEPLSALDRPLRDELGPRVRDLLRRERVAALWVTHDEEEARRLADRVLELREGKVVPKV
ncbi:MAG TPA: ABC transporter ATP-binding protein [Candidatus Thermoplasmatota archaeon]|nr:ABC transporter ATP-binding protein [Candidatus Thermoplasmatota archaeon]